MNVTPISERTHWAEMGVRETYMVVVQLIQQIIIFHLWMIIGILWCNSLLVWRPSAMKYRSRLWIQQLLYWNPALAWCRGI